MPTEDEIRAASRRMDRAAQELADLIDEHVQLGWSDTAGPIPRAFFKTYHPLSCPERKAPEAEVPDSFKRLFEDGAK